ncbi:F-box only protein 47-like [Protopterus annectens]|uniref:F-box only protein 47-like n=1 Tax=Protopterus annectens TaxID=7888 RepID=UPI001CF9AFFF|nr:F-box only protein 47-like [Protopterus annectens]
MDGAAGAAGSGMAMGRHAWLPLIGFVDHFKVMFILTAGWDELECHRVYSYICDLTALPRKIQTVVSSKPGAAWRLELRVRLFCRNVLLDHWENKSDAAFWLSRILKPWPIVNQARLLYIIFGPMSSADGGQIVWHKMSEGFADESTLKGLADAIKLLYDAEAKEWTTDDVISLTDELTVVPQIWILENTARLLILCGNSICFTFMASKAVNGRIIEVSHLMVFLSLVCEKDLYCMDWAVKMMQKICKVFSNSAERNSFLQNLEYSFARVNMDMLQSVMSGGREEDDSGFLNLYHLVNAQANFHKEILFLMMNHSMPN